MIDVVNCGLKLDILSFTGQVKGEFNRLQWSINADEYGLIELQSSEDAKNFSTIYSRSITHSLSDEFDHFNPSPKQYYRLKYTLSNGEFHYSNIILLESIKGLNISVINTKVEETLIVQITSNIEAKINYAIYDIRGVIMNQSSMHISEGVSQKSIDVGYLSSALYLIRFEDPSTGKLIIQKFVR